MAPQRIDLLHYKITIIWCSPLSLGTIPSACCGERQDGKGANKRVLGGGKPPYCKVVVVLKPYDCFWLAEDYFEAT